MRPDELTVFERLRLEALRDEIAAGTRATEELDGPDVCVMAYSRLLRSPGPECSCGRSDGERCHCRDP